MILKRRCIIYTWDKIIICHFINIKKIYAAILTGITLNLIIKYLKCMGKIIFSLIWDFQNINFNYLSA